MSHTYPQHAPVNYENQDNIQPQEDRKHPEPHGGCDNHSGINRKAVNNRLYATCERCGAKLRAKETLEEDGHVTVLEWEVIDGVRRE